MLLQHGVLFLSDVPNTIEATAQVGTQKIVLKFGIESPFGSLRLSTGR